MDIINLVAVEQEPIQGHTSKGDQPKWQLDGKWYKADHMGYEALAEVLISQLLKQSNVPDFVEYKPVLIQYQGKEIPGCVSKNFRRKDEMLVPFERLHRAYKGQGLAAALGRINEPQERIRYTVDFIEQTTGLTGVGEYLTFLLELDSFFLNEDRHTNNLAVIRNEKTKDMLHRAFGVIENPTWNDFEMFMKERCFPATRGNAKEILKELQLTCYDPLQIVEKTGGRAAEDDMWLKFNYYPMEGAAYGQNQS